MQAFKESVLQILNSCLSQPEQLSFWKLLVMGEYGPFSPQWVRVFQEIFALHLLVLSGSQAHGLQSFWKLSSIPLPKTGRRKIFGFMFGANFVVWLDAISWPAPLVRAFFLLTLQEVFPRLSVVLRIVISLGVHILCFPMHTLSSSFYLSWICYFCVLIASSLSKQYSLLYSSFLCWVVSWIVFRLQFSGIDQVLLLFFFNLLLTLIFEFFLVPIVGFILGLGFIGQLGFLGPKIFDAFLPKIVQGATQLILVVLSFFRYILRYDL